MTRTTLDLSDGGTWLIATESGSEYLVDLEARTVVRLASQESVAQQLDERWHVSLPMRRDGETLPLLGIVDPPIEVGRRARLLLGAVRREAVPDGRTYLHTERTTTPVTRIRRLRGPAG